jgi:hypothetical protein
VTRLKSLKDQRFGRRRGGGGKLLRLLKISLEKYKLKCEKNHRSNNSIKKKGLEAT